MIFQCHYHGDHWRAEADMSHGEAGQSLEQIRGTVLVEKKTLCNQ